MAKNIGAILKAPKQLVIEQVDVPSPEDHGLISNSNEIIKKNIFFFIY